MKGKGNISGCDTWVTKSDTCHTVFLAHFQKIPVKLFQLNRANWKHFTKQNCRTENAVIRIYVWTDEKLPKWQQLVQQQLKIILNSKQS